MSVFTTGRVTVLLADYANIDAAGKVNVLGGFFAPLGYNPQTKHAAAHQLIVVIDVPLSEAGQEFPLQLQLRNQTRGEVVRFISPEGRLEPLQIAQAQRVPPAPALPGLTLPPDHPIRMQTVLGIDAGVAAVEPGEHYAWKVSIDGQSKPGWDARFSVPGGPPPPVIGGLAGPADIPDLSPPPPVGPSDPQG
ncbi:MAG: hypothetical protein ACR2K2_01165 [Mycobacteriales bacterium]